MTAPRRRGTARCALAALLLLTACGDGDEALDPQMRAPETGSYAYDALVYTEDGAPPDTFSGTLVIGVSSEDSITGSWDVDGFESTARGIWNVTAYALLADPQPPVQGTLTHRISRGNGSSTLSCHLTYQRITMPADTFTSSAENSCSLDRE